MLCYPCNSLTLVTAQQIFHKQLSLPISIFKHAACHAPWAGEKLWYRFSLRKGTRSVEDPNLIAYYQKLLSVSKKLNLLPGKKAASLE